MLIGYVSDERYVALPDVLLEIQQDGQSGEPLVVRSTPRGGVYAALKPGRYVVTLAKDGFGSKTVSVELGAGAVHQFRLLSDDLLGYMSPLWIRAGQRGEFKVHSPEQYHLSLWRYGNEKKLVRMMGWFDEHGPTPTKQITPDGDYTQTGVQWNRVGYGNRHQPQTVIAPELSGLYYVHAKSKAGAFFSFPWIVAPATPTAPIAVLASTNTWNAYNSFGGRSNYINPDKLPDTPTVNGRQDLVRYRDQICYGSWHPADSEYRPLSFERPDLSCSVPENSMVDEPVAGRLSCVSAPGEWRLLAWLERKGFSYDLYAEAQLHFGELPLEAYKVLILSVHPEYWTREMYLRVKKWVYEEGGRLVYLAGNGLNCEVTLSPDGQMRCLTHLRSATGDMGGTPDEFGRKLESRMHRTLESEANLLGVVCTDAGIMTAAPYKVIDADHWVFAGTGLRVGDLFGVESLHERVPGGASGHETDKRSASSPPGVQLLAKGTNPDEGGAEIVWYDTPSGGQVFSAGSITYVSSLLVDDKISTIAANVLSRFLA